MKGRKTIILAVCHFLPVSQSGSAYPVTLMDT